VTAAKWQFSNESTQLNAEDRRRESSLQKFPSFYRSVGVVIVFC